ncbi:zinc transporter 6, chloroplastic-like [Telopea speciosissima]|uniref:zinc transporter 6, chloroplastic-like n=1 Tax=Telopea speciosissima TaxID=54955 RepID=UPI001CC4BAE1|nr:zinc transporter 6, chloroplastic-like [Telopea speciosissima]
MASCLTDATRELSCRDSRAATQLKLISMVVIFFTSIIGISSPVLLARLFQGKPIYEKALLVIKCFAAGVILSTSLVHVLPDAFAALSDCQVATHHPWKDFPFSGLVTLIGALLALLVDVTATSHVHGNKPSNYTPIGTQEETSIDSSLEKKTKVKVEPQIELGVMPVSCHDGGNKEQEELAKLKQKLVSQVLEIGIIFHSVIIGVTMGMSQNQCTIRPLVAALAFHQIFEGMGLGGCIAQAGFGLGTTSYMCFLFSVTTPMGIVMGMVVLSVTGYNDNSPSALILEGLLGSLSSGVLIYMALVDLIAADFFHNKMMSSEPWITKVSYIALVLGSASMSVLAIWA